MAKGFKAGTLSLDEPRSVYYSGQVLVGTVKFDLEEPLTCSAIKIIYVGQAIVKWMEYQSEQYNGQRRTREIEYTGRDIYFSSEQVLRGGTGPTMLPAGPHSINFSYQIPANAPSSFRGSKGAVTYRVSAILENLDMSREEISTDFEVIAPLDLNTIQDAKKPAMIEFEEVSNCSCFFQSKVIGVQISLPVSGYCPGQSMEIKVDAKNESNVEISKIIFQFVKRERYHSNQPFSTYIPPEEVLSSTVQGPILANTKRSFYCRMKVPDIIAYNLGNCNIIDIAYFLKAKIKMSGCMEDVKEERELFIGLIPLKETTDTAEEPYVHPLSYLLPQSAPPQPNLPIVSVPLQSPNQTYKIGFNVPSIPDIFVYPPTPMNNVPIPYENDFKPSAPPQSI